MTFLKFARGRLGVPVAFGSLIGLVSSIAMSATAASAQAPSVPALSLAEGKGSFTFTDDAVRPGKPITVWYYLAPGTAASKAPILFVMHGIKRNGESYRNQWVQSAEQHHLLLLVPQFDAKDFSTARYNRGNIVSATGKPEPSSKWTFQMIEDLFDYVKTGTGNTSPTYDIFGHSAGAQFVHRFVLLMPHARYRRAAAANAGYYTLPILTGGDPYPYSLEKTPETEEDLKTVFSRHFTILLGESDTNANDPDVTHNPQADKQGLYRLARGKYFMATAKTSAATLGVPLQWKLRTVSGVGHSDSGMEAAAAEALYGAGGQTP